MPRDTFPPSSHLTSWPYFTPWTLSDLFRLSILSHFFSWFSGPLSAPSFNSTGLQKLEFETESLLSFQTLSIDNFHCIQARGFNCCPYAGESHMFISSPVQTLSTVSCLDFSKN